MAGTCQMMRPKEAVSNWNATFPNEQTTVGQSILFMKKLLAISVSEILYLRAIFPEGAFGDRQVEDVRLKILSDKSTFAGASQVIQWMKGCFQALEKKYLRQLQLAVYLDPNKPDYVVESYIFRFSYKENDTTFTCNDEEVASTLGKEPSSDEIRKKTISLLRTVIRLTENLNMLPEPAYLGIKLLYYDEVTPPDYEPDGFVSCKTPNFVFDQEPLNVKVGDVSTKFHSMKLRIKTDKTQFEMEDDLFAPPVRNPGPTVIYQPDIPPATSSHINNASDTSMIGSPQLVPNVDKSPKASTNVDYDDDEEEIILPVAITLLNNNTNGLDNNISGVANQSVNGMEPRSDLSETSFKSQGDIVRCPCGDQENDGLMIQCQGCGFWQHGVCFTVLSNEDAQENHYCHLCAQISNPMKQPTDYYLQSLDNKNRKATCIWRRTLLTCFELRTIVASQIIAKFNVSSFVASSLIARLEREGFLAPGKGRHKNRKVIQKEHLKSVGMARYLTRQKTPGSVTASESVSSRGTGSAYKQHVTRSRSQLTGNDTEVEVLERSTEKLSMDQKKPTDQGCKVKTTKRKLAPNLSLSLTDSQDFSGSQNNLQRNKRIKSSTADQGIKV